MKKNQTKDYTLNIDQKGNVIVNNIEINERIFQEELFDYDVREREDQIDHLIDWISETGKDRENDKWLMKEDLKYLISLSDEYIFSSIGTNEYIARSDNKEVFNRLCNELIQTHIKLAYTIFIGRNYVDYGLVQYEKVPKDFIKSITNGEVEQ